MHEGSLVFLDAFITVTVRVVALALPMGISNEAQPNRGSDYALTVRLASSE